uniref:S ribonuclease n=1 Tax=Panagrellus redivivus TaxID=6233 RepID=A0A7E4ZWI2_PANRE
MDTSGFKPNAKEGHAAVQNDRFVHVFEERAFFSTTQGGSPEKSSHSETNASMAMSGSKHNSKEGYTALQHEEFVRDLKERACLSSLRRAINRPSKSAPTSHPEPNDHLVGQKNGQKVKIIADVTVSINERERKTIMRDQTATFK